MLLESSFYPVASQLRNIQFFRGMLGTNHDVVSIVVDLVSDSE